MEALTQQAHLPPDAEAYGIRIDGYGYGDGDGYGDGYGYGYGYGYGDGW